MYFYNVKHSLSCLFGGFIPWKKSSGDQLSSNTSSLCDAESLQLEVEGEGPIESGGGRRRHDRGR